MRISRIDIISIAESVGFNANIVEKVIYLLNLLNAINSHPFLKDKLALKGGTALNLFTFNIPRLSIDIDLNYVGSESRESLLENRPKIDKAIKAVFEREGFIVKRLPEEHAGGKWRLSYQSYTGQPGILEVDINFMFRTSLWDIKRMDSYIFGNYQAVNIPVLDIHELAAGKLAALFARHQARDLYDTNLLLKNKDLDIVRLRVAFVVFGALNRKDWRTVSLDDILFDSAELEKMLIPVLHKNAIPDKTKIKLFTENLTKECQKQLSLILPFKKNELEFLDKILERGEIEPSMITDDIELQSRIKKHPMLLWKALNVREYYKRT